MPLAKQIGTINKTKLSNAAHKNMNTEIYDRILAVTIAALHLESLAPGYKECIDREGECVNRITKSATTDQLVTKDGERDKTIQFIFSMNGSYLVCPDPAFQSAARTVDAVLRAYDKLYSKAYAEETALIDGLLAEYQEKHPNQITAQVIADFLADKPLTREDKGKDFIEFVQERLESDYSRNRIGRSRYENGTRRLVGGTHYVLATDEEFAAWTAQKGTGEQ